MPTCHLSRSQGQKGLQLRLLQPGREAVIRLKRNDHWALGYNLKTKVGAHGDATAWVMGGSRLYMAASLLGGYL